MQILFGNFNDLHTDLKLSGVCEKGVLIISPTGSIDTYNSTDFINAVKTQIPVSDPLRHVVFDLSSVTYISSTGIGAFTVLLTFCTCSKIEMHIWRVQEKVFDVFQLLGFTSFIHFINDLNEIEDGVAEKTVEPKIVACPHCNKMVKIVKAGKFKCGTCKGIIIVNDNMEISTE